MNIEKTQLELLSEAHLQWLQNPITVQFVKNLHKHRESFVSSMVAECNSFNIPDAAFRQKATNLKNIDAIINMIRDFKVFTELTNK